MVWCQTGIKLLSYQLRASLLTQMCVIRPRCTSNDRNEVSRYVDGGLLHLNAPECTRHNVFLYIKCYYMLHVSRHKYTWNTLEHILRDSHIWYDMHHMKCYTGLRRQRQDRAYIFLKKHIPGRDGSIASIVVRKLTHLNLEKIFFSLVYLLRLLWLGQISI